MDGFSVTLAKFSWVPVQVSSVLRGHSTMLNVCETKKTILLEIDGNAPRTWRILFEGKEVDVHIHTTWPLSPHIRTYLCI